MIFVDCDGNKTVENDKFQAGLKIFYYDQQILQI